MEKERGGAREGAGRKSKAFEQSLIERLTPLEPLAFKALNDALKDGKDWAVRLFFNYQYGMPKQMIVQENINYSEKELSKEEISKIKAEIESKY